MTRYKRHLTIALLLTLCSARLFAADALTAAAQDILKNHQDAVVNIEAVVNMTIKIGELGTQKKTFTAEALGTVIDESGLVVVSYSSIDQTHLTPSFETETPAGTVKVEMTSEISDIRIRYADGTKVPGKLALKDPEMDLAFLQPDTAQKVKRHLGSQPTAQAAVFEEVIRLSRAGKMTGHELLLQHDRVQGIMQKPTRLYITGGDKGTGAPVFNSAGKLIGVGVLKGEPGQPGGGGGDVNVEIKAMTVVMPMDEINRIAKQIGK